MSGAGFSHLSVVEHDASIYDYKAYAFGILMRIGEGGAVSHEPRDRKS
jgi:hypothetical protein